MKTDIEIAQETPLVHIREIAEEYGITEDELELVTAGNENFVTEDRFPDPVFRNYLLTEYVDSYYDKNKDHVLSESEVASIPKIDIYDLGLRSLQGIEYMTSVQYVWVDKNQLTSIDFSHNPELWSVACSDNQITSLDFSHNPKLDGLVCNNNQLTSINLTQNPALMAVYCNNNKLTSLDLSQNPLLEQVECDNNQLTSLDVSNKAKLWWLKCDDNQLTSLKVDNCPILTGIYCNNSRLTHVDLSTCPNLFTFYCNNNQLLYLNLTNKENLGVPKDPNSTDRYYFMDDATQTYIAASNTVDYSSFADFDVSKVKNLSGGSFSGKTLTIASGMASYEYDCGTYKDGKQILMRVNVCNNPQISAFTTRLYEKCLGRDPDNSGLVHWTQVLANKERSGAQVAYGFVFSEEYKNKKTTDEQFVEMLYRVFMDREADTAGKAHWMDLLSQGISREYVFRGFAQSQEYTNICNSYNINRGTVTLSQARDRNVNLTKYVNRMYTQALGRSGEEDGLNHWCKTIQSGVKTPEQVAESFITSAEFKNKNLSDEEYIKVLYRTFMGREYDQAGLEHWISELNRGCSREEILHRFATSREFRNIQASFGL